MLCSMLHRLLASKLQLADPQMFCCELQIK